MATHSRNKTRSTEVENRNRREKKRREEEKLRTGREGVALKIKMHRAVQLSIAQS
jgi:hypothetical protein